METTEKTIKDISRAQSLKEAAATLLVKKMFDEGDTSSLLDAGNIDLPATRFVPELEKVFQTIKENFKKKGIEELGKPLFDDPDRAEEYFANALRRNGISIPGGWDTTIFNKTKFFRKPEEKVKNIATLLGMLKKYPSVSSRFVSEKLQEYHHGRGGRPFQEGTVDELVDRFLGLRFRVELSLQKMLAALDEKNSATKPENEEKAKKKFYNAWGFFRKLSEKMEFPQLQKIAKNLKTEI